MPALLLAALLAAAPLPSPAATPPLSDTLSGTYKRKDGSTLTVRQLPRGRAKLLLQAFWMGPNATPAGIGQVATVLPVAKNDTAIYRAGGCTIRIAFTGLAATLAQSGDAGVCGFGHNVDASGTYKKTTTATTFILESGDRWDSTTPPK